MDFLDKTNDFNEEERYYNEFLTVLFKVVRNNFQHSSVPCRLLSAPVTVQIPAKHSGKDSAFFHPSLCSVQDRDPSKMHGRTYIGVPDWAVDVIPLDDRFENYQKSINAYLGAKVKEYWIVELHRKRVTTYITNQDRIDTMIYSFQDTIPVKIYDGVSIPFAQIQVSRNPSKKNAPKLERQFVDWDEPC